MGGGAPYIMLSRGEWFSTGVDNMEGCNPIKGHFKIWWGGELESIHQGSMGAPKRGLNTRLPVIVSQKLIKTQ